MGDEANTVEQVCLKIDKAIKLLDGVGDDLLGSTLDEHSVAVLNGLLNSILSTATALEGAANHYLAKTGQ